MNLKSDTQVIQQIFDHIDNGTTDLGSKRWNEPTHNYTSAKRFAAEIRLMKSVPMAFAPSAALSEAGSYIARPVAGVPVVVVRDKDMGLRAYHNACRHRGMTLVEGKGKASVFRCTYHGWAYGVDGTLQHVPHEAGFPDLDRECHNLVPIHSVEEHGGLVFVCLEEPIDRGALTDMPTVVPEDHGVFHYSEYEQDFNWKLNIEATLEGYHIKPTHEKSFYPYGYDNLNVVESFGPNGRITFPFRRIEELRTVPPEQRDISGKVTYVYNVFPACTVAVLTNHISVVMSEPTTPSHTNYFSYRLGKLDGSETEDVLAKMQRDAAFVADTGLIEDNAVVTRIQAGLNTNANTHFTYGLFEKAIVHMHENLARLIERVESSD